MYILAIASSCDDTSCAVMDGNFRVLSNVTASQKVHSEYGGVVPELASRAHQSNIIPVVDKALKDSGIRKEDLEAVAFTRGPGLLGSLLVGVSFAKSFAAALNIKMIEVNHLEAHVLAHLSKTHPKAKFPTSRCCVCWFREATHRLSVSILQEKWRLSARRLTMRQAKQ